MAQVKRCINFCLALLVITCLFQEGATTQIFHRPLAQVLTQATPVVFARLESCRVNSLPGSIEVELTLADIEVVRLRGPSCARLVYSHGTNLDRVINGRVHRVSPIYDGSGLETQLVVGEHYYFLLNANGSQVIRVEPESSASQIRQRF